MGSNAIAIDGRSVRTRALVLAVLGMCLALAVAPVPARATTLERLTTQDMSRRAATVVVGTVLSTSVEVHGGDARTAVRIAVADTLKGAPGPVATVYVPGGRLPSGIVEIVDEMPVFLPGEACAVFVDPRGWVMGGHQGKVAIAGGRIVSTGRPVSDLASAVRAANWSIVFGQAAADPLVVTGTLSTSGLTAATAPAISSISPGSVAAGIGARITITGSGFGPTPGTVTFFYRAGEPRIPANVIDSWSDTRIVCDVPVGTVNGYSASAGSEPVQVTTAGGATATRAIDVQFGNGQRQWADSFPAAPHARVGYRVNPGGVARAESLFDAAAGVWNGAGADFAFVDEGVINTDPVGGDGHNDISWASGLPSGVIAQATTWASNGTIVETHITFSTAFAWGDGSGSTMDIESIALHEIGHWLFLRDLYGSGDSAKVMYGFSGLGSVKRTLSSGDVAGIRYIYGTAPVVDTIAPTTGSDALASYTGKASITFTPSDTGGSGVAATYYRLDGAGQTAGTAVTVASVGAHTLEFWSVDGAGNEESPHHSVAFTVAAPAPGPAPGPAPAPAPAPAPVQTSITIARSTSSVRLPKPFTLSGRLTPGAYRDPCIVEVKKPGSGRWSYSSARLAYTAAGDWWYRYTPKVRGTYAFRARFAGDAARMGSVSGVVSVSVR